MNQNYILQNHYWSKGSTGSDSYRVFCSWTLSADGCAGISEDPNGAQPGPDDAVKIQPDSIYARFDAY